MKKFFLMLLAVVGISVAANAAQAGSCRISNTDYETVQAVVTKVEGNKVYFTLTTDYDKPVNAQVQVRAKTESCLSGCFEYGGGTAPGKGKESREYSVTFPKEVKSVMEIIVKSAVCN